MTLKFMGKKQGMTQVFDDKGSAVACTLISVEPNVVVQIKNEFLDGYKSIQVGAVDKKKNIKTPQIGHFKKAGVTPKTYLFESRLDDIDKYKVGQTLDLEFFTPGDFIDIQGTSKGKGYQGVMKLYNFKGGPASHGSGFHRHAGSTGMRSTPGRSLPGGKRASRMGGDKTTVQNLEVFAVDTEKQLLAIKGPVPGSIGSIVFLTKAKKRITNVNS